MLPQTVGRQRCRGVGALRSWRRVLAVVSECGNGLRALRRRLALRQCHCRELVRRRLRTLSLSSEELLGLHRLLVALYGVELRWLLLLYVGRQRYRKVGALWCCRRALAAVSECRNGLRALRRRLRSVRRETAVVVGVVRALRPAACSAPSARSVSVR